MMEMQAKEMAKLLQENKKLIESQQEDKVKEIFNQQSKL